MVEHDTVNVEVGGSSPLLAANICSNSLTVEAIALEAVAGGSIPSTLTINIKFENILIFLYNIYRS